MSSAATRRAVSRCLLGVERQWSLPGVVDVAQHGAHLAASQRRSRSRRAPELPGWDPSLNIRKVLTHDPTIHGPRVGRTASTLAREEEGNDAAVGRGAGQTSRGVRVKQQQQQQQQQQTTQGVSEAAMAEIKICRTVGEMRAAGRRQTGVSMGFVPTMGALHEGHLSLIRKAAQTHDSVVVSIFVNPTQFGVHEDLDAYPRTYAEDLAKLETLNGEFATAGYKGRVAVVFMPQVLEMYPSGPPSSALDAYGSFVTITPMGGLLEGKSRPVFFRGVATVVLKLLLIVRPDCVFFGEKDAQQCALIARLIKDFHVDCKLHIGPTEREPDGLAMSSRNVFLGERRRAVARCFPRALRDSLVVWQQGELEREKILAPAREKLERARSEQGGLNPGARARFDVEYLSLADRETMEEVDVVDPERGAVVSAALRMLPIEDPAEGEDLGESEGATRVLRLIDNVFLMPRVA